MGVSRQTKFVTLKDVRINDRFWEPILQRIRTTVIPYQWEALNDRVDGAEPSYTIRNFKLAAELTHPELDYGVAIDAGFGGFVFQESDLAKWIEAAAYTLVWHPDPNLEKTIDGVVDIICNAQQADGYLNAYYIISGLDKRFTNLKENHELYCFGHFLEAAIAYFEAGGKRKLLDAMIRYAECIDRLIGPEEGKLHGYPGHEIAEMALVRLYGITGDQKHLALAKYFIDERGKEPLFFEAEEKKYGAKTYNGIERYERYQYYQAEKPVREQYTAAGHAVRAVYLYSGMADVAGLTSDSGLLKNCEMIFANIIDKQMYITGGIGQTVHGEAFSGDYDLPNDTAYAETCAAIGLAFFAQRLAAARPLGIYADTLERVLYNGILSGMSLDGTAFFYVNPLETVPESGRRNPGIRHVKIERQKWFGCACCPPNIARIIASLGNYIHSFNQDSLYTHLYIGGDANFSIGGKELAISTETNYPWDGRVETVFKIKGCDLEFNYCFRIPGWCNSCHLELNGEKAEYTVQDAYGIIRHKWKNGDKLSIIFDMPVNVLQANPHVRHNAGKAAVGRGPLVYCLEEADNGGELHKLRLKTDAAFCIERQPNLLEGITTISCLGKRLRDWEGNDLYRQAAKPEYEEKPLIFIPYYAWANRKSGEMTVWVNRIS